MTEEDVQELIDIYGPRPVDPIVVEDMYVPTGLVDQHWREIVRRREPMGFVRFNRDRYNVIG